MRRVRVSGRPSGPGWVRLTRISGPAFSREALGAGDGFEQGGGAFGLEDEGHA